jgi:hypothetical protein
MFRIYGDDFGAMLERAFHNEIAGANKCFLVRERYAPPKLDSCKRWEQAHRPDDCCNDSVSVIYARCFYKPVHA